MNFKHIASKLSLISIMIFCCSFSSVLANNIFTQTKNNELLSILEQLNFNINHLSQMSDMLSIKLTAEDKNSLKNYLEKTQSLQKELKQLTNFPETPSSEIQSLYIEISNLLTDFEQCLKNKIFKFSSKSTSTTKTSYVKPFSLHSLHKEILNHIGRINKKSQDYGLSSINKIVRGVGADLSSSYIGRKFHRAAFYLPLLYGLSKNPSSLMPSQTTLTNNLSNPLPPSLSQTVKTTSYCPGSLY